MSSITMQVHNIETAYFISNFSLSEIPFVINPGLLSVRNNKDALVWVFIIALPYTRVSERDLRPTNVKRVIYTDEKFYR